MTRLVLLIALSLLHAPGAAALDPRAIDILTLRLGMTDAEVIRRLSEQGIAGPAVQREHQPCARSAPDPCLAIRARTRDGRLTVGFVRSGGRETVARIAYVLDGRGPGEPEMIRDSVLARFGPPTTDPPLTWCDRPARSGPCPAGQARLTFERGPGVTCILTLAGAEPPDMR